MKPSYRDIHHVWLIWIHAYKEWFSLKVCSNSIDLKGKTKINMGNCAFKADKQHNNLLLIVLQEDDRDENPLILLNYYFACIKGSYKIRQKE